MPDYDKSEGGGIRGVAPSISQELPPPRLTKLSAQLSYSYSTGHGCQVGIASKLSSPEDALIDIANELAFIAERAGLGRLVVNAVSQRVDEIRASLAQANPSTARHDNPSEDQAS